MCQNQAIKVNVVHLFVCVCVCLSVSTGLLKTTEWLCRRTMLGRTRSHPMSPMPRAFLFGLGRDKERASESRQKCWHSVSGASTLLWWEVRLGTRPCYIDSTLLENTINKTTTTKNILHLVPYCVDQSSDSLKTKPSISVLVESNWFCLVKWCFVNSVKPYVVGQHSIIC